MLLTVSSSSCGAGQPSNGSGSLRMSLTQQPKAIRYLYASGLVSPLALARSEPNRPGVCPAARWAAPMPADAFFRKSRRLNLMSTILAATEGHCRCAMRRSAVLLRKMARSGDRGVSHHFTRLSSTFAPPPGRRIATLPGRNPLRKFGRLLDSLIEFNQAWARSAAALVLTVGRSTYSHDGKPNRRFWHDVGPAVAQLTFPAAAQGLFVHQMAGIVPERARELFAIPDGWEPVAALPIGYLGDPASLPGVLRQRELAESTREPLSEFVSSAAWGQPPKKRPRGGRILLTPGRWMR